jgi:toxin ParE1/3/4
MAMADLLSIYDYVADAAGPRVVGDYIDRLESACRALAETSERGTRREDLGPGVRTVGFERRATIVFRVADTAVEILTIAHGGRDFEANFEP